EEADRGDARRLSRGRVRGLHPSGYGHRHGRAPGPQGDDLPQGAHDHHRQARGEASPQEPRGGLPGQVQARTVPDAITNGLTDAERHSDLDSLGDTDRYAVRHPDDDANGYADSIDDT